MFISIQLSEMHGMGRVNTRSEIWCTSFIAVNITFRVHQTMAET